MQDATSIMKLRCVLGMTTMILCFGRECIPGCSYMCLEVEEREAQSHMELQAAARGALYEKTLN
jgi:hypothetical protein